jgi:hypothetical protein
VVVVAAEPRLISFDQLPFRIAQSAETVAGRFASIVRRS